MKMKYCPQCGSALEESPIDGRLRLSCADPACDYVFWNNPTPVVAAIVERGEEVILVRNRGWPEKMYGLVSGFLEEGETPDQAVVREVLEELGLEAEVASFIGYYSFFPMNQLILAFHVKAQGEIKMGDELADFRAIPPERLKPWRYGTGFAVSDWLRSKGIEA